MSFLTPWDAGSMVTDALAGRSPGAHAVRRLVVVGFNGVALGIMSFSFGLFHMAIHYGATPDLDVRIVSGEQDAVLRSGGLACDVPHDLVAIRTADLIIVPNWRAPARALRG